MNIKRLENSWFFQFSKIKVWDILFDEWDVDNFLYIIKSGKISIEKYTTSEKKETKQLAILWKWDIFWEGSLSNNNPKEVKIIALEDSILLKIGWKDELANFLKKLPKEWIDLLSQVIQSSNKRLLEANFLITSNYTIVKYISGISEFNNKNLFTIIDNLLTIISADYVLYIEKSPVFENVFISRYDTREPWKMQEKIMQIDDMLDVQELWLKKENNTLVKPLRIGNKIIWYLVIWWKKAFTDWEKKSVSIISLSIAWFVKQKQNKEEEKE
jgi:CRP-like cAMP-binding protein